MDKSYFKKDLVKALILMIFSLVVLAFLLYFDSKSQIFEVWSQRLL
ncbi:hypothetical protein KJ840_05150 [Patescibacteria group bacterium]|nr:hypothetical protein [Patescibacteria group bacterium]